MENKSNQQNDPSKSAKHYFGITLLRNQIFHLCIITLIGVMVYANTLHAPFQFDDTSYINPRNMRINPSDFLDAASIIRESVPEDTFKAGMLTRRFGLLTFILNYKLHDFSVTGFHLVNIFIHLVTALLVYVLITRLWHTPFIDGCFQRAEEERERLSRWTAFLGAALFVAHPINTQAVTYIVQRFASLATMFYLLALLAYISSMIRRERVSSAILYGIALSAAVLAMFTKEISFTLPAVMLLSDRLFLQRPMRQTLLAITPFLMTMAIIPWNLYQAKSLLASSARDLSVGMGALAGNTTMSRHDYFLTELRVIVTYIRLLFFPINQNLDYDYPVYTSLFAPPVLASLLLLLSIATVGFVLLRLSVLRSDRLAVLYRLSAFGIFWFFMTLSVESSIQPIENVLYEHRLYLPFFGFALATVCGGALLWKRIAVVSLTRARIMPAAGLTAVIVLACVASIRNSVWQNSVTLWEDVASKSPHKARVQTNLGGMYHKNGDFYKSMQHVIKAIQCDPRFAPAYFLLAQISFEQKLYDQALQYYQKALEISPNKTYVFVDIGKTYYLMGNIPEAVVAYKTAISSDKSLFEAYYNLGIAYNSQKQYDKALVEYQHAEAILNNYAPLFNNLGVTYANLGLYDKSLKSFKKALQLDPTHLNAQTNLQIIGARISSSH